MADDRQTRTVHRCIADLVALEGEIEAALAGQQHVVAAHPGWRRRCSGSTPSRRGSATPSTNTW